MTQFGPLVWKEISLDFSGNIFLSLDSLQFTRQPYFVIYFTVQKALKLGWVL